MASIATLAALSLTLSGHAQSRPRTPTIRILAPGTDMRIAMAIRPEEVKRNVRLCLDGKVEQRFSLQERTGMAATP